MRKLFWFSLSLVVATTVVAQVGGPGGPGGGGSGGPGGGGSASSAAVFQRTASYFHADLRASGYAEGPTEVFSIVHETEYEGDIPEHFQPIQGHTTLWTDHETWLTKEGGIGADAYVEVEDNIGGGNARWPTVSLGRGSDMAGFERAAGRMFSRPGTFRAYGHAFNGRAAGWAWKNLLMTGAFEQQDSGTHDVLPVVAFEWDLSVAGTPPPEEQPDTFTPAYELPEVHGTLTGGLNPLGDTYSYSIDGPEQLPNGLFEYVLRVQVSTVSGLVTVFEKREPAGIDGELRLEQADFEDNGLVLPQSVNGHEFSYSGTLTWELEAGQEMGFALEIASYDFELGVEGSPQTGGGTGGVGGGL